MIANDPRWDAEMLAALHSDQTAGPAVPAPPFDEQRLAADTSAVSERDGGPRMAHSEDRWVLARGRRVMCRVYRPLAVPSLPILVYLHGGGWVFGSLDTYDRVMRGLAAGGACAVVGVDYALSPEAVFPRALEECVAVLHRVGAEAAAWGLDPRRLVLGGDSAGANLAFATALRLRETGHEGPVWQALRGILTIYPVCDPAMDSASYGEFSAGYGLTAADMAAFWDLYAPEPPLHPVAAARGDDQASFGGVERTSPFASIIDAELGGLPSSMILAAELDVLRSEGEVMAERLDAAGVKVARWTAKGMAHGFMRRLPDAAKSRAAVVVASAWLRERTAP